MPADTPMRTLFYVVALIVLLPLLYAGGYLALSRPAKLIVCGVSESGPVSGVKHVPQFVVGGKVAEFLFRPATRIDQRLRPEFWDSRQ